MTLTFKDVPQFPVSRYSCSVGWSFLAQWLARYERDGFALELAPAYQRGYVWTDAQQTAYVEYILRGGRTGRDLFWNCQTWDALDGDPNRLEIVDGKQRLAAARAFLHGEVRAFGQTCSEFGRMNPCAFEFVMHVNNLPSEAEVVAWYLAMNTGGSVHTLLDLQPARERLEKLTAAEPGGRNKKR